MNLGQIPFKSTYGGGNDPRFLLSATATDGEIIFYDATIGKWTSYLGFVFNINTFMLNAPEITADFFYGTLIGSASQVSVVATNTSSAVHYLTFCTGNTGGAQTIRTDSSLTYTPSTNSLTATTFNGTATLMYITSVSTNDTYYITFVNSFESGSYAMNSDTNLQYNPSTNTLTCPTFVGNLTGTASQITITATDTGTGPYYITFATSGSSILRADTGLTYNSTTNALTATSFVGTASVATQIATTATNTGTANYNITFVASGSSGNQNLRTDTGLLYVPTDNTIFANLNGSVSVATEAVSSDLHNIIMTNGTDAIKPLKTTTSIYCYPNIGAFYVASLTAVNGFGLAVYGASSSYIFGDRDPYNGSPPSPYFAWLDYYNYVQHGTFNWYNQANGTTATIDYYGNMTALSFTGPISITATNSPTSADYFPTFVSSDAGGTQSLRTDTSFKYNPNTNTLTCPNVTGNADTATQIATTTTNTSGTAHFITFVETNTSGNKVLRTDSGLTYTPTGNILTATSFVGDLTGNVDGTCDTATYVESVPVVSGTTKYLAFFDLSTGAQAVQLSTPLVYNATTQDLTSPTLSTSTLDFTNVGATLSTCKDGLGASPTQRQVLGYDTTDGMKWLDVPVRVAYATFTSATSITSVVCFNASNFRDYRLVIKVSSGTAQSSILLQLRSGATTLSTSVYNYNRIIGATSTSRTTETSWSLTQSTPNYAYTLEVDLYNPASAITHSIRTTNLPHFTTSGTTFSQQSINGNCTNTAQADAFVITASSAITGTYAVYGMPNN